MSTKEFSTLTFGKWILCGEHSVLRGSPALVFPLRGLSLDFRYQSGGSEIKMTSSGAQGQDLKFLFWSVVEKAGQKLSKRQSEFFGEFEIKNEVPIGSGLGASAAFCVAFSRWVQNRGWIASDQVESFACDMENIFHGESSGVDIAIAHGEKPLRFLRSGPREILTPQWQPHLYLSFSGQRGVTRECVEKVKDLWQTDSVLSASIDAQMKLSVEIAESALKANSKVGLPELVRAMNLAEECFQSWGLTEGSPSSAIQKLKSLGALAAKPTGSGGGGYVVSLWPQALEHPQSIGLISCF